MPQVIIYSNTNGGVSVCTPTGELPIDEVLKKDCPAGAIIVDASVLPEADNDFFNAWRLNGSTITVDIPTAQAIQLNNINTAAKQEAQHRATNTAVGIANALSDAEFVTLLTNKRAAVAAATTTVEIRAVRYDDIQTA
jgi:hypothetical protein